MKRISAPELSAEQRASFIFLFNKHGNNNSNNSNNKKYIQVKKETIERWGKKTMSISFFEYLFCLSEIINFVPTRFSFHSFYITN